MITVTNLVKTFFTYLKIKSNHINSGGAELYWS